jgi:hypothetical protein
MVAIQQQVKGSTCMRAAGLFPARMGPAARVLSAVLLGVVGCLSSGCVSLGGLWNSKDAATPAKDIPCQVSVRWHNDVVQAPDPMHAGRPTPGLVGRVYLFNNTMEPVEGEGSMHVELSDASVNPPKVLERWNLPPEAVQQFKRKDVIGIGYSMFLPWATYRPELSTVQLRVAYQPKSGPALYSTPSKVSLGGLTSPLVSHRASLGPKAPAQIATAPAAR